ncbi:MAG: type I-B CRISPR-associated protein Cas7/Csh2 [bacterium]|nr:type I-B CRISPR-associated protein Cas7/Csh2 [bacterium]
MSNIIKNRSEILFIYDIENGNPNGDALDNKPRIDELTNYNIVTDVRLKRTIRDYLQDFKGREIFIRKERDENNNLKTRDEIFQAYKEINEVINRCIDIRLFGGTFSIKNNNYALTGPVQFKFGRSLHKVDINYIKGTTVLPSAGERQQGTFWETYLLPYSLICFYGIINENAAKETRLTEEDVELLLEAIYYGTNNLITRSKPSQQSRLLLQIVYKQNNFHIGDLDKKIKLNLKVEKDEYIRSYKDYELDLTELYNTLINNKDKIEKIRYIINPNLIYKPYIDELKNNLNLEELRNLK